MKTAALDSDAQAQLLLKNPSLPFCIDSIHAMLLVRADRDAVRRHQKDADQWQCREDAVVGARNRFGALRQLQARRHGLNEKDAKEVDHAQREEHLDAERFEHLGAVVIQLVGKGHDRLTKPNRSQCQKWLRILQP